ncbi:unnamed protein product [Rotaria socialis]|uniref:Uncharacterized protein n=1 Tax=Rotaria socialis TaxID=392032 RepID=A0A818JXP4_9BILA|nr:unnamed protein product [Rotaria socialis]CAF3378748.1 unnamed protein product [Rotaria socialis]CAF3547691.1 unnamed protein product [Rotaria socialis]CAF4379023.1 unnamed protein product [Rotaria socialis]CAF4492729.1 unnamed protein product [Rotaria socialis]
MIIRCIVRVILFLYLFVQSSSTTYLLCTSKCPQITVSFFQPLNIPEECQHNNTTDIYEHGLVCVIDYRIDYDAKHIYINFKTSNDVYKFQEYNQLEYLTQTIWLGFNEASGQPNITHRTYACSTRNDCARQFYYNTIEHLIRYGELQLDQIKSTLYRQTLSVKRNASRRCKNSNTTGDRSTIRCRDGLCYANNANEKTYCAYDHSPTFFSEFEYYIPRLTTNEIESIEYKCNRHLCNSNKMINTIKDILRNYTNWNNINENPIDEEYPDQTKEDYQVTEKYEIKKENQTKEDYQVTEGYEIKKENQTKEGYQVTEKYEMKKENQTKEDYQIKLKSSTVRQDTSYILMILTLINLRFLF